MEEQNYRFKVCVRSLIYNHEKYINDCLRGFMMQEVNFPVVFLLEDDASTDSTSQILSDWVNTNFNVEDKEVARVIDFEGAVTTFAQHRTNPYFFVAYIQMKYNHYRKFSRDAYNSEWRNSAKYEAQCEGDDYWTDPLKLQKQVDILEADEDYAICFHAVQPVCAVTLNKLDWRIPLLGEVATGKVTLEDFCFYEYGRLQWTFQTSCFMYRRELYMDEIPASLAQNLSEFPYGDMVTILRSLYNGYGYYLDEVMSCYRVDSGGYNSSLLKSPQKQIQQERKLAFALKHFDEVTNFVYHNDIMSRVALCEYRVIMCGEGNRLKLLAPKYWTCTGSKSTRQLVLFYISIFFPLLRRLLKKIRLSFVK